MSAAFLCDPSALLAHPQKHSHPDVTFVHRPDAPLGVDAKRALGLVWGYRTHRRSLVRARHVAGEVTHWKQEADDLDQSSGGVYWEIPTAPEPQSSPSQVQP